MRKLVFGMLMLLVGLAVSGLGGCGQESCMEEIALMSQDVGSDVPEGRPDQALAEADTPAVESQAQTEQEDLPAAQKYDAFAVIPDVTELEASITNVEEGCDLDGPSSEMHVAGVSDTETATVAAAEADMPEQGQEDFTILEMDTDVAPVAQVAVNASESPDAPELSILEAVAESELAVQSIQETVTAEVADASAEKLVADVEHQTEAASEEVALVESENDNLEVMSVPGISAFDITADVKLPEAEVAVAVEPTSPVVAEVEADELIMSLAPGEDGSKTQDNLVADLPEMSEIADLFEAETEEVNSPVKETKKTEAVIEQPKVEVELAQVTPEETSIHTSAVVSQQPEKKEQKQTLDESWQQAMLEFDGEGLRLEEQAPVISAENEDNAIDEVAETEAEKAEDGEIPLDEARSDAEGKAGVDVAKEGAGVVDEMTAETEASMKVAEDNAKSQDEKLIDEAQTIQNTEDKQLSGKSETSTSKMDKVLAMEKIRRQARLAEARNYARQGKELFEAGQYNNALKALDKALKIDPNVADARELRDRTRALVGKSSLGGDNALRNELTRVRDVRLRERTMSINNNLEQASNYYLKAVSPNEQRRMLTRSEQIKAGLDDLDVAQLKAQAANTLLQGSGISMAMEKTLSMRIKALMAQISDSRKSLIEEKAMIDRAQAQQKARMASSRVQQEQTNQVEALFKAARHDLGREDFEKALETVDMILRIDPVNTKAEELKKEIEKRSHIVNSEKNMKNLTNSEENWQLDVKEAYVLPRKVLIYPLDWERIKMRSKLSNSGEVADFEKRKLMNKLAQVRVPVEYADLPLNMVMADFRNRAGVNIMLDKDVNAEMPITISLRGVSWLTAFEQILESNDLKFRVRNQAIEVFEKGSIGSSEYTLRIYQVADLVNPMNNYYAPEMLNSSGDGWGDDDDDDDDDDDEWNIEPVNLPEQIRNFVPGDWENEMSAVELWEDNLLVRQTPEVHAKVNGYLDKLRESAKLQVLVEGRFMDITDNFLDAIGFDWTSAYSSSNTTGNQQWQTGMTISPAALPNSNYYYGYPDSTNTPTLGGMTSNLSYLLSHSPINYLLNSMSLNLAFNASEKTEKGSVLHNPKVLVANGRNAYAQVVVMTPFMTGYTISGTRVLPVVTDIYQGVTWDARPIISFDRKYITVRVRPQIQNINDNYSGQVSRTVSLAITDDNTVYSYPSVTLVNPVTQVTQFETNATVPDGGTVLIGGMLKDASSDSISGIPVLSSIPRLGRLFRTEYSQREGSNRVIMVSAKIVELED